MMDMNREHHQTPVDRGGTHLCENKMVIIMGGGEGEMNILVLALGLPVRAISSQCFVPEIGSGKQVTWSCL